MFNDFSHREVDAGYKTPCHRALKANGEPLAATPEGYVRVGRKVDGVKVYTGTHRARFAAVQPLADTDVVDHLCRNRWCCNPAHLERVDTAENVRRGDCSKLTGDQVAKVRALVASGVSQTAAAKQFGLSQSHVSRMVRGLYWSAGPCLHWQQRKAGTANL